MVKKTKLTISGIAKKSIENIELAKTQGKNSVIIEKKNKFYNKGSLNRSSGNLRTKNKPTFQTKTSSFTNLAVPFFVLNLAFELGNSFSASAYPSSSKFKQHFNLPHCPDIF